MKSKKNSDWKLSKARYNDLLKFADSCVSSLVNELQYVNGDTNQIALQSMVLGHMMSQSWFKAMQRKVAKQSPRDGLEVANDWAMQVANDATADYPESFTGDQLGEPLQKMVEAFKELLQSETLPKGFCLSRVWLEAACKLSEYESASALVEKQ